jgi:quaternary ammonium compound-resistance protein SugE
MISWIYILIASSCEIGWIYSLKYFNFKQLMTFRITRLFVSWENFLLLAPGLGYIGFGVGNIIFFSKAMKHIPASAAFATWMAVALIGVKLVDVLVLKETVSLPNIVFMTLIVIGIIGLKIYH